MTPGGCRRVLICDNHQLLRLGARLLLETEEDFVVVGEAEDGLEAIEMVELLKPDIVLMDLKMPKLDGAAATERIKASSPETFVVILTAFDSEANVLSSSRAGADGFIVKDEATNDLVSALRRVLRGEAVLAPSAQAAVMKRLRAGPTGPLSDREIEIVEHVALGLQNKQIGEKVHLSYKTVKNHVANAMSKLGAHNRTHLVSVAHERGLIDLGRLRA